MFQKFAAIWKHFRFYGKRYAFLATFSGAVIAGIRFYYWAPNPKVVLDFDAVMTMFMRPDFGISDDLKAMGYREHESEVVGMANYDMLLGKLFNKGNRDCDMVEVKFPIHGNVRFGKVAGLPQNPSTLSRDEKKVKPDQYVQLGPLRPDDAPVVISFFSNWHQLKTITFRYKDGDATKTCEYLVNREPPSENGKITKVVFWGMDMNGLKRLLRNTAIGISIIASLGLAAYLLRGRIRAGINRFLRPASAVPPPTNSKNRRKSRGKSATNNRRHQK